MKKMILFMVFAFPTVVFAQSVGELMQKANDYYKSQQYTQAASAYKKVLEADPGNITAQFNEGNVLYKQGKKVEAATQFTALAAKVTDPSILARIQYNKGVILSDQKNIEESIEAYKSSLRNDPADNEARENLQKALQELRQKKEQKEKEQKEKEQKENKKKKDEQKQPQSKMNPRDAEQRLKLLQQKEKETQQKVRQQRSKSGTPQQKDW